ncbi:MAG: hypothetical protein JW825_06635 [Candidatus Methanofastidiosa archaeon]|nr:hypothetical protein [Candidatus Methanofastidiosa archaeon]
MDVRVSLGSEAKLGLRKIKEITPTNTIYLLTRGICNASCEFCAQSSQEESRCLSRVNWNIWEFETLIPLLKDQKRVCIQCLNYPEVYEDLLEMVKRIKAPISVSAQPFSLEEMHELSRYVEKISISLDCFTKEIFSRHKSFYDWELHWTRLKKAVEIFGKNNVISHMIVGLGETEKEAVNTMYDIFSAGALPSLFAFTPLKGTKLSNRHPPDIGKYRRLQIARQLLQKRVIDPDDIQYEKGRIASFGDGILEVGVEAFETQGCPHCNRPYYNESPGKTLYNHPFGLKEERLHQLISEADLRF